MDTSEDYGQTVYTQTMAALKVRSEKPGFNIDAVEAEYDALCVYQGHGFAGRNFMKDAEIQGQIDAYQVFIYRWKQKAE